MRINNELNSLQKQAVAPAKVETNEQQSTNIVMRKKIESEVASFDPTARARQARTVENQSAKTKNPVESQQEAEALAKTTADMMRTNPTRAMVAQATQAPADIVRLLG